jgi:transposase-like protein
MPWKTERVMDQRVAFVLRAEQGDESLAELCREYEISRPTGYLWLKRYRAGGNIMDLAEHSRRPLHTPRRTDRTIETAVLALRDEKGWGGPKLAKVLGQRGVKVAPATAQRILKRAGRVRAPAAPQATVVVFSMGSGP